MSKQKILELHVRDSEVQLRAANAALRESEQKYRSMVEIIPDWVWQIDRGGIYTYSSPNVKDLLGYEVEEVIGKTPFDLMPDAEAERMRAIFRDLMVSRRSLERLENTNVRKNGHLVVLETSAVAIYDERGEFAGYRGVDRDITERKKAEQQIEVLSRFPGENPSPVLRISIEGNLLYANDASDTILKEWGSVIGQGVPEKWCNYIREAFESEEQKKIEIKHHEKIFSFIITPVIEAGYANLYGRDITERRKSEIERERLMDSLAEKSGEMERLLRIVTHDLRSPLVNIMGFSSELESDCQKIVEALNSIQMDEQVRENISDIANEYIPDSLNFITSSTKKMDGLITSLSQLSQLGRIELHIEAINMDEMIGEIVKATLYKVKQEGVSITYEHLPDCKGDDKQVNQVFANVIGNAIKYLDPARKGQIKITGQVEGPMSVYCVEDNGVGIPDKHKDKVFEIFHRVDPKSHIAGEGIGLTAAKQMVGRLGGKIRVESEVGVGSKFFISLPVA